MVKVFADQSALQAERGDAPRGKDEEPGNQLQLDDPGDDGDRPENRRLDKVHNDLKRYNKLKQLTTFKLKMLKFKVVSLTRLKNLHKNLEGLTSPRKDCRCTRTWRSMQCWKRLTKEGLFWELKNQHHLSKQRGGGCMVRVLKCEEAIERMIVILGIEYERVCPREVELALNLKEELNAIEENLVQMATI